MSWRLLVGIPVVLKCTEISTLLGQFHYNELAWGREQRAVKVLSGYRPAASL